MHGRRKAVFTVTRNNGGGERAGNASSGHSLGNSTVLERETRAWVWRERRRWDVGAAFDRWWGVQAAGVRAGGSALTAQVRAWE